MSLLDAVLRGLDLRHEDPTPPAGERAAGTVRDFFRGLAPQPPAPLPEPTPWYAHGTLNLLLLLGT